MSRVLVTGSAGLVGRALREALEAAGYAVAGFDLLEDPSCDIRDAARLEAALAGCDGVVHLAAVSRVAWGEADPALCADVNVAGTEAVIAAACAQPSPPWMVFASSREVYGDPAAFPVREDAAPAPVNAYGRSKLAGEWAVRRSGLRAAILRLSNVYGTEHDHPDRAVPALLWRALRGEALEITGGDVFFDFVHVEDCARGLRLACERLAGGAALPPVQLVTGRRTSLRELARAAIAATGSASAVVERPPRPFDVGGFVGDPGRARAVLGFAAAIPLEEGLDRLRDRLAATGPIPPVRMPPRRIYPSRPAAAPSSRKAKG